MSPKAHFVTLAALSLASACSEGPETRPGGADATDAGAGGRHAVILTIDTWRADAFGAGGHPGLRTPHIDRAFRRGTQFTEAYSPVSTTLASHTSLLTGAWPTTHGVPRNLFPVPDDVVSLAEILQDAGWRTGAYVSSAALAAEFGLDQGFDVYNSQATQAVRGDYAWRPAGDTLERAMRWWRVSPERKFLWVHLFEPHFPYDPPAVDRALTDTGYRGPVDGSMEFLARLWSAPSVPEEIRAHLESLYHAEITALDRTLGDFLRFVEEEGALLVITSDHGESTGEYGQYFVHGANVFDHETRIPLAVTGGGFPSGVRGAMVRTLDVPAAVLGVLGVGADLPQEAGNLRDALAADAPDLPVYGVASRPWSVEETGRYANAAKQRVIRTRDRAWVETPWASRADAFDRAADPGELVPLPGGPADEALKRALDEWIGGARHVEEEEEFAPELREKLESLGYVE